VSIDDFALRKRHRYGTILIDLETGKTVDMIESRNADDVSEWLRNFPDIDLVSRDGSLTYRQAITRSHPDALQVSDRFHLIKGLSEHAKSEIEMMVPSTITLEPDKAVVSAYDEETVPLGLSEKQTKKLDLIKEIKRCYDKQQSILELSRTFGLNRKTVHNYVHGALPSFTRNRTSNLDRYRETITIWIREKTRIKTMYDRLVKEGAEITYGNLRYYVKKVKSKMPIEQDTIKISRFHVIRLLYNKGISDLSITKDEQDGIKLFLRRNKRIQEIINTVMDFRIILESKTTDRLEAWMNRVTSSNYSQILKFVNGIRKDYDAVVNGILLKASNGKIEGKINKLKKIKRDMYGRCSFGLLKGKFFLAENQPV
jgi:transposase